ncbi:phage major capsid protein [Caloranaerobacter azorensis]|uniref:Phage major capsid protein n=1 Tax=Caloranaerobacter azorensis TaxID=116090 RepID=A0A6P1YAJ8_9FIRM|nr:phage major capsid protein [Caloranaerobacter azorensis]QIB26094.1 phage major capsid protein [Caloranaerobacter azorensis]
MKNNQQILKSDIVGAIKKNLNITFPANDAYQFLVDTINYASTLKMLQPMYKTVPAGKIDILTVGRRRLREADDESNVIPTGVGSISKRQIDYAVKKVFWDEWLKNDDVYYNAIRQTTSHMQQPGITNTADLETLVFQMLQKQLAMDLQDLAFNGDTETLNTDPDYDFLKILDGFVKKMKQSPHKTDLGTNEPTLLDFLNHVQLLPEKYKNNYQDSIKWFITRKTHDKIMALVQARATGYGDAVLVDGRITRLAGYDVEVVAGMQSGFAALTPKENLVPIFTQDIKYKRVGDDVLCAKKDSTYHIFHAYLDCIIREIDAVAWMSGEKL